MAENNKSNEGNSPKRINEILEMAAMENETKRKIERSTEEIDAVCEETAEEKRLELAEENEARFDDLRKSLAAEISSDPEISSYVAGRKSKMQSAKVDDIYTIIGNDKNKEAGNGKNTSDTVKSIPRLSSLEEAPKFETSEQVSMFVTGELEIKDGAEEPEQAADNSFETVTLDDYNSLSEKIESGEITLLTDEPDEDQIRLGLADTRMIDLDISPNTASISAADAKLKLAFGLLNKDDESVPDEVRDIDGDSVFATARTRRRESKKQTNREQKPPEYEYTSPAQDDEVVSMLEKTVLKNRIKAALVLVLTVLIAIMEINPSESSLLPALIAPGRYGMLYILVDLQLLLLVAITLMDNFIGGAKSLFKYTPTPDSVFFAAVVFPTLHAIATAVMIPTEKKLTLFCLGGAVAGLVAIVSKLSQSKRDLKCFLIVSANGEKYCAEELNGATKEASEFYKYLLKDSELYTVKKTAFVSGFFERIQKRPKSDDLLGFQLPLILLAAVIAAVISYVGSRDLYSAINAAGVLAATSLPLSSFIVTVLPVNAANIIARNRKSALVGNAVADEYDNAGVISFTDAEVFPAKNIKISGFRTYGDYRIDKIILTTASIFKNLGGSLSEVFSRAISDQPEEKHIFRVIDVDTDGLIASMDGHDYFIGRRSFMRKNRFDVRRDTSDDEFEDNCGSVMYVAVDDDLAAKIYIKYKANPAFNSLLRDMYNAGVCVGIKTLDPNISNELLQRCITYKKCPIAILKADTKDEVFGSAESISSGIVSGGTMHTFLKMFILADKTRHCVRTNAIINFVSVFLSFAIVFFLLATGSVASLNSVFAMLFQLIWILPIGVLSFLM